MDNGQNVASNKGSQDTNKIKAVALLSGGIDSSLAAKLVSEFDIDVIGISFPSPFCICNTNSSNYECAALFFAEKIGLPLEMKAKENDYLNLLKEQMELNPNNIEICIHCKVYIFKKVKEYMKEIGAQFIITGEILGAKPDKKTIDLLLKIDELAGVQGLVLRPFSASWLPESIPEKKRWVNRNILLELQGKNPNIKYSAGKDVASVRNFCSSEGCLVIDKKFSNIVQDYLHNTQNPTMQEIELLKLGSNFRFKGVKILHSEHPSFKNIIECEKQTGYLIIFTNPRKNLTRYSYVEEVQDPEILEFAEQLCAFYPKAFNSQASIQYIDLSNKHSQEKMIQNKKFKFKHFLIK